MLEAAASGVLVQPIELKTSRAGRPYANMALAIDAGQDENGKQLTTWLRAAVFGETAEELALKAQKGVKIYCEGALSLNSWQGSDGATKTGLSMACWRAQIIGAGAIGRNRRKPGSTSQGERQLKGASFAGDIEPEPHQREKPRIIGRDEFNDRIDDLPFLRRDR